MAFSKALLSALCMSSAALADLVGIPTVPFTTSGQGSFDLHQVRNIVVDSKYADSRDTEGWTLIPPSLSEFADTFAGDLQDSIGRRVSTGTVGQGYGQSIFLTVGNNSEFKDAAGRWTSEAYEIKVGSSQVTITGASPLGIFWGTRSLLQQAALNGGKIQAGSGVDSPGWNTRGIFLDAGRHYYPPSFITEMCAWISYYKQNTFHLHLSDNLYNNVDIYSPERQASLYAAFRPWSDDPAVAGLNKRRNESYTRDDLDLIQSKCAARGVTIIPEIEAPGHALVITQWKPELAIEGQSDLLNISNPDTIPTMQTIWKTFLPWFHSKVVHIGADEYVDSQLSKDALAEVYNTFVNAMNEYIYSESEKTMRIWGTFPPQANYSSQIATNVTIQHWEFFEDNPYFDYIKNNYSVINSDDAFYIVQKYSTSYPQELNRTRIFHGNPAGGAYSPNIFDINNATNNPPRDSPFVVGHIAAQWNDYGPNTSTYLEAYQSWRTNLPALADKQWGGELTEEQYDQIYDTLQIAAPKQNLDRRVQLKGSTIVDYQFKSQGGRPGWGGGGGRWGGWGGWGGFWGGQGGGHGGGQGGGHGPGPGGQKGNVQDSSGNGYNARTDCAVGNGAVRIAEGCSVSTPLTSKGNDYTLSFSVQQTSNTPGSIFTGPDSELRSGNGTSTQVMLVSAGNAFALNYSLPVGQWVDASLIARGNRTFFSVNSGSEMEFLTSVGVNGERHELARMAVVAPLQTIGAGAWEGQIKSVKLVDHA